MLVNVSSEARDTSNQRNEHMITVLTAMTLLISTSLEESTTTPNTETLNMTNIQVFTSSKSTLVNTQNQP